MRSRLEARYAALLDSMKVPWSYEERCFASQGGQYLPDFTIHTGSLTHYIEVRPHFEGALRAIDQMKIVRENDPLAYLVIAFPDPLRERYWIQLHSDPDDRQWRIGWMLAG